MKRSRLSLKPAVVALACFSVLALCPPPLGAGEISEATAAQRLELRLPDLKGQDRDLGDFLGKVVLVNFWASWCTPCIKEMPSIQRLADQMRDKPFAVIGVNVEESRFRAMSIAQRLKLGFPVLLDTEGEVFKRWGATVLPTTYVLDPMGLVRYIGRGPIEWDAADVLAMLEGLAKAPAQSAPSDQQEADVPETEGSPRGY
jgi:thiol-disulfide isomerase/thioredoxin